MRERTHGYVGIDHPGPGEKQQSWVRQPRRGAVGPRPVRPPVATGSARPEGDARPAQAGPVASEADSAARARAGALRRLGSAATGRGWRVGQVARPWQATPLSSSAARWAGACGGTADSVRLTRRVPVVRGPRLLVRSPIPPTQPPTGRVRRIAAGLAVALVAAAVVFGLGRVADAASHAREPAAPVVAEITVTVDAPGTVWDVVDGVAPNVTGPQRAAMVDRIVVVNSLTSVRVRPGEVLRVPLQ